MASRVRSSGRRAAARAAGVLGPGGENPMAHAAVAAIAALTVATGVVATLGLRGSGGAPPSIAVNQTHPAAPAGRLAFTSAPSSGASAVPVASQATAGPSPAVPAPAGGSGGRGAGPVNPSLHYTNPIGPTGHNAEVAAKGQHVVVNVPNVVIVGLNPQMVTTYASGVLKKSGL